MSLLDLETKVYSRLNNKVKSALKKTYPKLNFVDTDKQSSTPTYPLVYVHELESAEIGQDFDNTTINGVLSSFEITVYSDYSQEVNKEIMNEVVYVMKSMRYNIVGTPFNDNEDGLYRRICRFRRPVGAGDTL